MAIAVTSIQKPFTAGGELNFVISNTRFVWNGKAKMLSTWVPVSASAAYNYSSPNRFLIKYPLFERSVDEKRYSDPTFT